MKTFYIGDGNCTPDADETVFVIGVKGTNCDLDNWIRKHQQLQIVTRWPDVKNIRYLRPQQEIEDEEYEEEEEDDHILQPAIVYYKG